jgi:hypothetical protein
LIDKGLNDRMAFNLNRMTIGQHALQLVIRFIAIAEVALRIHEAPNANTIGIDFERVGNDLQTIRSDVLQTINMVRFQTKDWLNFFFQTGNESEEKASRMIASNQKQR